MALGNLLRSGDKPIESQGRPTEGLGAEYTVEFYGNESEMRSVRPLPQKIQIGSREYALLKVLGQLNKRKCTKKLACKGPKSVVFSARNMLVWPSQQNKAVLELNKKIMVPHCQK